MFICVVHLQGMEHYCLLETIYKAGAAVTFSLPLFQATILLKGTDGNCCTYLLILPAGIVHSQCVFTT